nr:PDZ domain-containing protein [Woeseiaceae bacterium]
ARSAFPEQTGMLTVDRVIPGSPADELLKPGDILIRVNGEMVTEFVPLAAILDDNVGEEITVDLERGGSAVSETLAVSDLHAITPSEYLEVGDAIVNELSYQQARHYNLPVEGVYVANPGYLMSKSGVPRGAVITQFGSDDIRDLDDFETALDALADGSRALLRYVTIDNPQNPIVRPLEMDRVWFPVRRCTRDDATGVWPCRELGDGPEPEPVEVGSTRFNKYDDSRVNAVAPSLVVVSFDLPYTVSGVAERHYYGTGIIVDAERGLVVVDRNTVPVAIGDTTITFAGSLEVNAEVVALHPLHNFAIVSYDPETIGDTPVKAATFNTTPLQSGDETLVVGIKSDHQLARQAGVVASVEPLVLPLSRTLRFRDSNIEGISLVNGPTDFDGVLVDRKGRVQATWSSFMIQGGGEASQFNRGVGADVVREFVDTVIEDRPFYSLEAEFVYAPLFAARNMGVDEEWLERLEANNPEQRRALSVARLVAGSAAAELLKNGDIVLAVDDEVVTSFRALEKAVQRPEVSVTVWRNGEQLDFDLETAALDGRGIDRVASWAGALIQDPHRPMAVQRGIDPYGVYVAFFSYGSPSTRYGLWAGRRVVQIDDTPIPDLETFVDVVASKEDQESVRVTTVTWNGAVEVITLKLDNQYWPAYEIRRTEDGWQRSAIGS